MLVLVSSYIFVKKTSVIICRSLVGAKLTINSENNTISKQMRCLLTDRA